jgi:hypothetical protein
MKKPFDVLAEGLISKEVGATGFERGDALPRPL